MREPEAPSERLRIDLRLSRSEFRFRAQLELPMKGVTAVFGPSGSGKTTFLRAIAGLEPDAKGSLWVSDICFQDDEQGHFLPVEKRGIAYVFQESGLFPHLSVLGNLLYAWKRAPKERRSGSIEAVAGAVGISHLLKRATPGLSGGEGQRVALARALLSFPRLLLMDEPLASLDEGARQMLLSKLESLSVETKVPILYVTHSTLEVARLADRVLLFDKGEASISSSVAATLSEVAFYSDGAPDVLSRLNVEASGYDQEHRIAHYKYGEDLIFIPSKSPPTEGSTRLVVRARDLSISLSQPNDSSVLNAIPVRVISFQRVEPATVLLRCKASGGELTASITSLAFKRLELEEGIECMVQLKATALYSEPLT